MANQTPLRVDGKSTPFRSGESVLETLLRAQIHPTGGGCLCCTGDCVHCVATVDGVAYVKTCQVTARAGLEVRTEHLSGNAPPLPVTMPGPAERTVTTRHLHCDVAVLGAGRSGCCEARRLAAEGLDVLVVEARPSRARAARHHPEIDAEVLLGEAVGIYTGPLVVVRAPAGTGSTGGTGAVHVHCRNEVVVATGAGWISPLAPGSDLQGIYTPDAASILDRAGFDLANVLHVVDASQRSDPRRPETSDSRHLADAGRTVAGRPVRFLPRPGSRHIAEVEVATTDGELRRLDCDSVVLHLGRQPRDGLARMGAGLAVRAVGAVACPSEPPVWRADTPSEAVVCACARVTVADLDSVYRRGFTNLELVKRATLAGTGACQGAGCTVHLRSFLSARGVTSPQPFTARPLARPMTVEEFAAGAHHPVTARTALHEEHRRLGAKMERSGGWWRPWSYDGLAEEVGAVREAVALADASTLGKFLLDGPDAERLLRHVIASPLSSLRASRCRYALLLDERGSLLDDGMVCRESETRFYLTLTSGGAEFGELWLRDWIDGLGLDVRLLNQTESVAVINVTGPHAARLLVRGGAGDLPTFASWLRTTVCGVPCRVLRMSFTGELTYELHHDPEHSTHLWRSLLDLGADLHAAPLGLHALLALRLEKGHLVVGKDTAFDATPRRLGLERLVRRPTTAGKLDDFVGRAALERTAGFPLDRQLLPLSMELPAPMEGAVVFRQPSGQELDETHTEAKPHCGLEACGYVTSAAAAADGGGAVMLAWVDLEEGERPPSRLRIEGRAAQIVELPFYDTEHQRARAPIDLPRLRAEEARAAPTSVRGEGELAHRFRRQHGLRIIAAVEALDRLLEDQRFFVALRFADDDALLIDTRMPQEKEALLQFEAVTRLRMEDPYAFVEAQSTFVGCWLADTEMRELMTQHCAWPLPADDLPSLAQGAVAGIPVKLWIERERTLLLVAASHAAELEQRLGLDTEGAP